jgi:hypothetical protein
MAASATRPLALHILAFRLDGEMATYGHRAILLRASVPERMAWCSAVLAEHPPRPIRLSPLDQAALEAVLGEAVGPVRNVRVVAAVGRAAAVGYERVFVEADPVVTIALPLLGVPRYRDAVRRLLRDDWRWSRETWALVVRDAAEELLRTAPGRLTVPELAFTLLGTMHRLADPTGIRWGRMLEGRG